MKLGSKILISDSMHTRSDIYVSTGVLATLTGIRAGLPPIIDPIASLIVAGFIFYAAYEIFKDNSDVLVDKVAVDIKKVRDITLSFVEVKDTHNIRSRGSGNDLHIDMHIMTEPDMSIEESHKLIHSIEEKMREEISENVQVIAHLEPYEKE
jgi:cation diffusion facilitator family transporter